jgi:hypothetical protein
MTGANDAEVIALLKRYSKQPAALRHKPDS